MKDEYTHEHTMALEGRVIRCITCGIIDTYQDIPLSDEFFAKQCLECHNPLLAVEETDELCLLCLENMGLHLEIEEVLFV